MVLRTVTSTLAPAAIDAQASTFGSSSLVGVKKLIPSALTSRLETTASI